MRKLIVRINYALICALLVLVGGIAFSEALQTSPAHADTNYWRVPGRHKLAENGRSPEALNCAQTGLRMSADVAAKFLAKVQKGPGKLIELTDGTRISLMTFGSCKTTKDIVVMWGDNAPYPRDAEVVEVTANDGTVITFIRPFVCNNWSILAVVPPKPKPHCFVVRFDYSKNEHVMAAGNLRSAGELVANGSWKGSSDQAYLESDTLFAFVLMHLDFVDDAELARFEQDECTFVSDETGVHHVVEWDCELCLHGIWPPLALLQELVEARGVTLPVQKPNGAFRFPCANGICEFSMPLSMARRFLACVQVPRYRITLPGYGRYHDEDNFDMVTDQDIQEALRRGTRARDDVSLRKYLDGAASYTTPQTY